LFGLRQVGSRLTVALLVLALLGMTPMGVYVCSSLLPSDGTAVMASEANGEVVYLAPCSPSLANFMTQNAVSGIPAYLATPFLHVLQVTAVAVLFLIFLLEWGWTKPQEHKTIPPTPPPTIQLLD